MMTNQLHYWHATTTVHIAPAEHHKSRTMLTTVQLHRALVPSIPLYIYLLIFFLLLAGPVSAQFPPSDILRFANISDPQISPDGKRVVYVVSTTENNKSHSSLWIARAIGEPRLQPTLLLPGNWSASNPRWSPDGNRIAFLGSDGQQNGLWILTLEDQRPRFVAAVRNTNFFITYAGNPLEWAPDSHRIAFIGAAETGERQASSADPQVIDRIQYKSRTSFSDDLRTHVWIVDADSGSPAQQLTSGKTYDHAISFSPRGDEIAFVSNHESDPDANNNSDIFAVNLQGQVRQITDTKGCEYEPDWSPDGKWIAYTATKREITTIDSIAEDAHVWVIDAKGGTGRELTGAMNRRNRNPRWAANSGAIYFTAADRGAINVFSVSTGTSRIRRLFTARERPISDDAINGAYQVVSFTNSVQSPAAFALVIGTAVRPPEVWLAVDDLTVSTARTLRRLSGHNLASVSSQRFVDQEDINFKSFDGTSVQGWLIKPRNWTSGQQYPLILSIHGGPHGMFGYAFSPTFQAYAAAGYAVLFINPRGSSGYGQSFSDGTLNQWGGGDYRDLMTGLDYVLKNNTWIDPGRLGVTGGSYGGFMTNWIITQTPRFRAAVASASVSNLVSFYSTSLYQDLVHAEFSGFPWDNYELLWQWSPIRYVKQVQTPTLFIHGERDNDVHITQAEEMYMALRRRGVDTVFVRYPREGHGLNEPQHRVDALERTIAWFDKYLK
jgi:dipeptidyl aminopeptidase/acylaminoacyl peptidase